MSTLDPDTGVREEAEEWFVGWVENAEIRRSWGEIALTAHTDGYGVRHTDDTEASVEELDSYDDTSKAREIAKFDDGGEYRPMNGETTLPTGWVFPSLDADGLTEVVRYLYPASVENRYLELHEELDVTHWDETAGRQTGIYAKAENLEGDALRRATDAFCASRCAKRREWAESEEADIDSPAEGDFPCREACSLFVSGAREFVGQEEENENDEETVEIRKGDAEALLEALDALSDGRAPRRGELGDGGNEYRAQYTASKLREVV